MTNQFISTGVEISPEMASVLVGLFAGLVLLEMRSMFRITKLEMWVEALRQQGDDK